MKASKTNRAVNSGIYIFTTVAFSIVKIGLAVVFMGYEIPPMAILSFMGTIIFSLLNISTFKSYTYTIVEYPDGKVKRPMSLYFFETLSSIFLVLGFVISTLDG